jgi:hypothetical protein
MFGDGFEQSTILRTGPDGLKLGQAEESSGAGRSFTARRWRSRLFGGRTRADCELWCGLPLRRLVRGLAFRPPHGWPRKASRAIR